MNDHYYLLIIIMLLLFSYMVFPIINDWKYSSDGDLVGTQTKYIEAKHNIYIEKMNNILDLGFLGRE